MEKTVGDTSVRMIPKYKPTGDLSVAELRELLAKKEREEADAQKVLRESVKPVYKFTIELVNDTYNKILDDSVKQYCLRGTVMNKEALEAVGAKISEGGINYLYNTLSGKIVMMLGGGMVWLGYHGEEGYFDAIEKIEYCIEASPEGCDITDIVMEVREARGF